MEYLGKDKFIWFYGVVEDINDPLKIGRCRVRILAAHTHDSSILPTDALPWASPIMPITSASIAGVGISPTGILVGAWVVGFFIDSIGNQEPVLFGTIPGIPKSPDITTVKFGDTGNKYPSLNETSIHNSVVGESDVNRLSRGDKTSDTIVKDKIDSVVSNALFKEPITKYKTIYPYNKVISTESGHHQEFDDTPGGERIHTYHKSGSFEEYHPNGDRVTKIIGDDYEIIKGDKNMHIEGNINLVVSGDCNIKVKGVWDSDVSGKYINISNESIVLHAPKINLN
ncbi:MAG: hypothetical protein HOM01_15085 [Kordiimonadaceae bacterium]|nr:hypothetical protein [Kordiimonadaceae bacterium]